MAASMNSHAAAVPHTGSRNVLMHRSVQLYSYSALPVLHVARVYMHSYVASSYRSTSSTAAALSSSGRYMYCRRQSAAASAIQRIRRLRTHPVYGELYSCTAVGWVDLQSRDFAISPAGQRAHAFTWRRKTVLAPRSVGFKSTGCILGLRTRVIESRDGSLRRLAGWGEGV